MFIARMTVLVLAGIMSSTTIADDLGTAEPQPGLFDGMAEDVQRRLDKNHADRQANVYKSDPNVDAEPGLFDGMAADVQRSLDENHEARLANRNKPDPNVDTQPGLFDDMVGDVQRSLDEKQAARQK
jgi:hypothetical protein